MTVALVVSLRRRRRRQLGGRGHGAGGRSSSSPSPWPPSLLVALAATAGSIDGGARAALVVAAAVRPGRRRGAAVRGRDGVHGRARRVRRRPRRVRRDGGAGRRVGDDGPARRAVHGRPARLALPAPDRSRRPTGRRAGPDGRRAVLRRDHLGDGRSRPPAPAGGRRRSGRCSFAVSDWILGFDRFVRPLRNASRRRDGHVPPRPAPPDPRPRRRPDVGTDDHPGRQNDCSL